MPESVLSVASRFSMDHQHGDGGRQFACLILGPHHDGLDGRDAQRDAQDVAILEDAWLAACRDLTPAVERLSPRRALLDLGVCSLDDARAALEALMWRVARTGQRVRAGIAPGLTLAELAALMAPPDQPLLALTPDALQIFLRRVPVTALLHLAAAGPDRVPPSITPEIVERLERYGLRRLGDLARLSEPALRRQFGAAGGFLAAVAAGRDERPLQPTPPPVEWRARLRLGSAAAPERVLAALEPFGAWMAARLRREGRQTRRLRVRLRWECGCAQHAHLSLREHTHDAALLTQELCRLVAALLVAHGLLATGDGAHTQALDGLWIALGDFAPVFPSQASFWRTREQQLAAARLVADTLARRHGRPLLLHTEPAQPAAVYHEERLQLAALPAAERTRAPRQARRRDATRLSVVPDGPWQTVPQRLHWW
jgi:hypothetical protein